MPTPRPATFQGPRARIPFGFHTRHFRKVLFRVRRKKKEDQASLNPWAQCCGRWKSHLFAGAPGDVDLLGEGNGGVVVGDLADGSAVAAGEGDAVVDVEDAAGAAGRVDVAGGGDAVGLGVDLARLPDAAACDGGLGGGGGAGVLAEVVGAVKGAGDALLELSVAVVGGLDNGELEAAGVLCRECLLALAFVSLTFTGMGVCTGSTFRERWSWQFLVLAVGS